MAPQDDEPTTKMEPKDASDESLSILDSKWNEAKFPGIHSSGNPMTIKIKTEVE